MQQRSASLGNKWLEEAKSSLADGACVGQGPDLWYGDHVCDQVCDRPAGCTARKEEERFTRVRKAKAVCNSCPVQDYCLEYALVTDQTIGIWGGLTERERRGLQQKRRIV